MPSWKDLGFDANLAKKMETSKNEQDYSIHGKSIEARTFPFILPMKTTAQRNAMRSISKGLMIYNTTTNRINVWTGTAWIECSATSTSSSSSSSSSSSTTT